MTLDRAAVTRLRMAGSLRSVANRRRCPHADGAIPAARGTNPPGAATGGAASWFPTNHAGRHATLGRIGTFMHDVTVAAADLDAPLDAIGTIAATRRTIAATLAAVATDDTPNADHAAAISTATRVLDALIAAGAIPAHLRPAPHDPDVAVLRLLAHAARLLARSAATAERLGDVASRPPTPAFC